MMKTQALFLLFGFLGLDFSSAFVPLPQPQRHQHTSSPSPSSSTTSLASGYMLLDVPDAFFTTTFLGAGILLGLSKNFNRIRMEERAWEQRLEEGRRRRLEQDPTLTELDLRRREAAMEWSAYGKPRMEEVAYKKQQQEEEEENYSRRGRGKRVKVMDREMDEDEEDYVQRQNTMTDDEIEQFEMEFGIDYDPYYDDPYTEEELPEGNFRVDNKFGDRIYEDGEIFYMDKETRLYFRQGAKPRSVTFFGP